MARALTVRTPVKFIPFASVRKDNKWKPFVMAERFYFYATFTDVQQIMYETAAGNLETLQRGFIKSNTISFSDFQVETFNSLETGSVENVNLTSNSGIFLNPSHNPYYMAWFHNFNGDETISEDDLFELTAPTINNIDFSN